MALAAAALVSPGCSVPWIRPSPIKYETVPANNSRDVKTAKVKHAEALAVLDKIPKECCLLFANLDPAAPAPDEKHLARAEGLLNEALVADVRYGPAHNTLGMVYHLQDKPYLAAWEFEYAAKLMPERAEPFNNLGLVYERAGKLEDAISYYSMAMSRDSSDPQVMGNLVRARLTHGEKSDDIKTMISDLALNHPEPIWRQWAKDQVALAKFESPSENLSEPWQRPGLPSEALPTPIREPASVLPAGPRLELPESIVPLESAAAPSS